MITFDIDYEELNEYNDEYIYNEISSIDNLQVNNGEYYIGMCFISENNLMYENKIPNKIFYKHKNNELLNYLIKFSSTIPNWQRIEIMKLDCKKNINGLDIYFCILKTHYIRLVQRTWKRVFKERQRHLNDSNWIISNLRKRELGLIHTIRLPGLIGLFI
tara:strand:- start:55 stop:534 length:480 start_codon:yes stop_codon:yes gene_type:complete